MLDHVTIRVSDREASERFYDTVLPTLGIEKLVSDERGAEWGDFAMAPATDEQPVTRRLHIGFLASSRAHVDRFWQAGVDAGYRDDGAPGPRPQYSPDYYGGFLLDPDGNSAEAVHNPVGRTGTFDHLWLRVADVAAAAAFYRTIAPSTGFYQSGDQPDHAHFPGPDGSFSLVPGEPTVNAHIAFPATDDDVVDEFHRAALAAGYRDNGPPGERLVYHAGYYAAFVLDPDGNNVEVVNHNR
jgi:catechol 2,3-dioxygenase-like lactoylglutathione lyase family enzyme